MTANQVKDLDGNTFVVSDDRGDIEASLTDPTGLFSFDTRFLSKWILTVNGQRLTPLSVDDLRVGLDVALRNGDAVDVGDHIDE